MQALLNKIPQLAQSKTENSQENRAIYTKSSIMSRRICPCCSYMLLRHLGLAGHYWRCSHCYQEMPAF